MGKDCEVSGEFLPRAMEAKPFVEVRRAAMEQCSFVNQVQDGFLRYLASVAVVL